MAHMNFPPDSYTSNCAFWNILFGFSFPLFLLLLYCLLYCRLRTDKFTQKLEEEKLLQR